jgi:transglutaminase-like putative cysteine protease
MNPHLAATPFIDHEHPAVREFVARNSHAGSAPREQAVQLYYAVRDGFRYDPYRIDPTVQGLSASRVIESGHGWCVTKAVLLAACARALGIPARLGFADVKNHLTSQRLRETMGTDVFFWHGFTELWLNEKWVKATPAFNIELCDKACIKPLEFDGREDSIYHPFDKAGRKHMEYLNLRGSFDDVPMQAMLATFVQQYGAAAANQNPLATGRFEADVASEAHAGSRTRD